MFISIPTGLGKSIIYSILPLCLKKLCPSINTFILIISPLISLMDYQISSLKCSAVLLHKDLDSAALVENSHVFCSSERLLSSPKWRKVLMVDSVAEQLVAIYIDEAHCIVKW